MLQCKDNESVVSSCKEDMIRMAETLSNQRGRHKEDTINREWYAGAVTANTTHYKFNYIVCVPSFESISLKISVVIFLKIVVMITTKRSDHHWLFIVIFTTFKYQWSSLPFVQWAVWQGFHYIFLVTVTKSFLQWSFEFYICPIWYQPKGDCII